MYRIATDTSANLPWSYIQDHGLIVIPFSYHIDGQELSETPGSFDGHAYYQALRDGRHASTSQIPPQRFVDLFTPVLEEGQDVLFLSMSSGISGSCHSAQMAAEELRETFPDRRVAVVDTLAASLGEGLLVMRAVELQAQGLELDDAIRAIRREVPTLCQLLMVDDLMHLRRTGRVSGVSAVVGSMLGIKPILKGSPAGQLVVSAKVRGRKQAVRAMADRYAELAVDPAGQTVAIAHADCPADAQRLAELIRAANQPKEIVTVCYEPVTGAHTGPDALALFFFGGEDVRTKY